MNRKILLLQGAVFIYSVNTVCGKMASSHEPFSLPFLLWFGAELLMLMIYALIWQQVIKTVELGTAYANKSVTLLWSLLFGVLLFQEGVTLRKVLALPLVIGGTCLMNLGQRREGEEAP